MDPKIWGPSTWVFLHLTSMSYPDNPSNEDIQRHTEFLNAFSKILPCKVCRTHFEENLRNTPLEHVLSSKDSYMRYLHQVHNRVNRMSGKPELNFDNYIKTYQDIISLDTFNPIAIRNQNKNLKYILTGVLILITFGIVGGGIFFYKFGKHI